MASHQTNTANPANMECTVDFLLPTGILIPISCRYGQTMEEIKELLWRTAENYPLYSSLKPSRWYTLIFVNRKAEQEECLDETQRLSDLQIYKPLFKVFKAPSAVNHKN